MPYPNDRDAARANLNALAYVLHDASRRAEEAATMISNSTSQGEQNQAIGAVIGLDATLDTALALFKAALALTARSLASAAGRK